MVLLEFGNIIVQTNRHIQCDVMHYHKSIHSPAFRNKGKLFVLYGSLSCLLKLNGVLKQHTFNDREINNRRHFNYENLLVYNLKFQWKFYLSNE